MHPGGRAEVELFGTSLDEGFVLQSGILDRSVVGVLDFLEPCLEWVGGGMEMGSFARVQDGDADFGDFGMVVLEGFAVDADEDGVLDWGGGSLG